MSVTSGRVTANASTQGRCVPRSSKKKAKLAKRAAKLLARRESEAARVGCQQSPVIPCAVDEHTAHEGLATVTVPGARDNVLSSSINDASSQGSDSENRISANVHKHILAYCSDMSSSTVEMIAKTAAEEQEHCAVDGSCLLDSPRNAGPSAEQGWHVVENLIVREDDDEGFVIVNGE